jgi:hypothetical protein
MRATRGVRAHGLERWTMLGLDLCLPLLGAVVMIAQQLEWIRARTSIMLAAIGLLGAMVSQWRHVRPADVALLVGLAGIPVALLVPSALLEPHVGMYELTLAGARSACAFLVSLPLWRMGARVGPPETAGDAPRWLAIAAVAGSIALAAIGRFHLSGGVGLVIDENVYLFQADHVLKQPRGFPVDAGFVPFLIQRCMYYHDGFLNGQYTPGWPAFLALLRLGRLDAVAGPLVFVATIAVVMAAGRHLCSWRAGILAGALTAVNWTFVFFGVSYFSHTFAAAIALLAFYCLLRSTQRHPRFRARLEAAAGALIGVVILVRPLTGLSIGAGLALWNYLRRRSDTSVVRSVAHIGLGTAVPAGVLLAYNFMCTGHPFRFGYDEASADLGGLGFGLRGMITYDPRGRALATAAEFGPLEGTVSWLSMLADSLTAFWPSLVILPLVFACITQGLRIRWYQATPFMALPLTHLFYYLRDARLFVELIPFAMLATACLADELYKRRARTMPVMLAVLVLTMAGGAYSYLERHRLVQSELAYFSRVDELRATFGRLLIFVREADGVYPDTPGLSVTALVRGERRALERLFWYNTRGFPGNVVVVRDLPDRRRELAACFPEHQPVLLTARFDDRGFWADPAVQTLPRVQPSASDERCFAAQ